MTGEIVEEAITRMKAIGRPVPTLAQRHGCRRELWRHLECLEHLAEAPSPITTDLFVEWIEAEAIVVDACVESYEEGHRRGQQDAEGWRVCAIIAIGLVLLIVLEQLLTGTS